VRSLRSRGRPGCGRRVHLLLQLLLAQLLLLDLLLLDLLLLNLLLTDLLLRNWLWLNLLLAQLLLLQLLLLDLLLDLLLAKLLLLNWLLRDLRRLGRQPVRLTLSRWPAPPVSTNGRGNRQIGVRLCLETGRFWWAALPGYAILWFDL
jgi:hypothetical protein